VKSKNILKLILISILIGGISGVFIGIFLIFLEKAVDINLKHKFLVFILPLSGMLMTFLYSKYGGNSQKGNNLIIENINGSKEEIKFIMAPLVFLGTVLTHLFGGSVGREGTGVQIGGTIGNALSKILKCSTYEKKILLISGVAAGFSSVFGTPITGTIFALEISNIGSLNYNSMIPAITSAIVGNSVVKILGVKHSHYKIPPVESVDLTNILKVIILAICFGLASRLFVYMTHWFKEKLIKYCKNQYLKIFVGGSLMVLATLLLGNSLYNNLSLGLLSSAFDGNVSYLAFIIKLMLTTLCLGAGYQGGEVTPLFVIGATLGATLSNILGLPFAFSAALGLVGVFSGATNAPIACFMMYLELFGSNNIIFAMLVCMIAVFISGHKGIYTSQLWNE
jgi:H+/Cl- antiporter ClcA